MGMDRMTPRERVLVLTRGTLKEAAAEGKENLGRGREGRGGYRRERQRPGRLLQAGGPAGDERDNFGAGLSQLSGTETMYLLPERGVR